MLVNLRSVIYEILQVSFITLFSVLTLSVSQGKPGLPGLAGIAVSCYFCVELSIFGQQLLMVCFHSSLWCPNVFVDLLKENPES